MPNNPTYVDPSKFNPINLFKVVLNDDRQGLVGWVIKDDTASNYAHSMTLRKIGIVDSQEMFFSERPLSAYQKPSNMLKFWSIKNLTSDEWNILDTAIRNDLNKPFWQRFYNYLGVLGQATPWTRWISFPGTYFCSQRTDSYLRLLPRFAAVLPVNVSPGYEDTFFTAHPELMVCDGYCWQD